MKVVHLAFNHRYNDIRIFEKECVSLTENGYDVVYITSSKHSPLIDRQRIKGVEIIVIPVSEDNRYVRLVKFLRKAYKEAISQKADIYHIHEIYYLPLISCLRKHGKVIFDSHEDHPRDIFAGKLRKQKWWEKLGERIFEAYEKHCVKKISGVIAATPHIAEQFYGVNDNIEVIENYPILEEFDTIKHGSYDTRIIFYGGGISENNGILSIVEAMEEIDGTLVLAGKITKEFREKLVRLEGWRKVKEIGYITREEMKQWYLKCCCGIVLYLPVKNAIGAIPNKLFEYMAAGVPVVASNLESWKEIIDDNQCGICVNPQNRKEIVKAINYILDNPQEAERMGKNGYKCTKTKFSWEYGGVKRKLIMFYQRL